MMILCAMRVTSKDSEKLRATLVWLLLTVVLFIGAQIAEPLSLLVLIVPIPFIYCLLHVRRAWVTGCWLGVLLAIGLLWDVLCALGSMATSWFVAVGLIVGLCSYITFIVSAWVALCSYLSQFLPTSTSWWLIGWWAVSWWGLFVFFDSACLMPLGCIAWHGCPFMSPVVPMINSYIVQLALQYVGRVGTIGIMTLPACIGAGALYAHRYDWLFYAGILIFFFVPHGKYKEQKPLWSSSIASLSLSVHGIIDRSACAGFIARQAKVFHDDITHTVCMPESAVSGDSDLMQVIASEWEQCAHGKALIIGAQRTNNQGEKFNSVYFTKHGVVQAVCDKQACLPFVERLPSWLSWAKHRNFFHVGRQICNGTTRRPVFDLEGVSVVPYICSELLCAYWPDDDHGDLPILALCNDWWFERSSAKHLLLKAAMVRAVQWQRSVIYVSYSHFVIISPHGTIWELKRK